MNSEKPLCDLDETWEDITDAFTNSLKECSTWKCFSVEGVDKEGILSAPEIMDPKTDSGLGGEEVYSLSHLLSTGEIPPPSSFADDASLIELMDFLHVRELHYLRGYSLVQSYLCFPYFLQLDKLKDGNPVMYTYCRAMLRTLESVLRAAFVTTIRGDEEFLAGPPELEMYMNMDVEEVMKELEEVAAKASPAVALRLRWRRNFMAALALFQNAASREDVEKACAWCEEARQWLEDAMYQRKEEPAVKPSLIRDKEMRYWVTVITPTEPLPQPAFAEAMSEYKTMLGQISSLSTLFTLPNLMNITEFVEDLGSQNAKLLVRCITVIVLFSRDTNESFLFGPPLHQRLLGMLGNVYGAPLYQKIFENQPVVESVVRYRIQKAKGLDPTRVTPEQLEALRRQTVETVQHWTTEACKHFLIHLEIMLCNRGLAHRRLMNAVPGLAEFQEISYLTDLNIFQFRTTGGNTAVEQEGAKISKVLTLWANSLVLKVIEMIIKFQVELDLLKPGELIPALFYLSTIHKAAAENMLLLDLQSTAMIPENRTTKKRVPLYNLCLATRGAGNVPQYERTLNDVYRIVADCQLFAACIAEKKGLMDFESTGSASLTNAETIFNHRYFKCFRSIQSPPFATYRNCIDTKPVIKDDEVLTDAKKASTLALNAVEKIQWLLHQPATDAWQGRREKLDKLERSARGLAASLSLMSNESTSASTFESTCSRPGLPYYLTFSLRKKESAQK